MIEKGEEFGLVLGLKGDNTDRREEVKSVSEGEMGVHWMGEEGKREPGRVGHGKEWEKGEI
jgi:hypothetical protein